MRHLSVICAERQRITFALDAERESLLASQSAVKDLALRMQECAEEMEREVIRLRAERVINIERVKELVSSMEEGAVIRGGQHLMERWGELRKELGLE